MKLYWNQNNLPALQGLTPAERDAAKRAVIAKVWKHWQVWLPFACLLSAYAVFFVVAPHFPYRFVVVIISLMVLSRVAALPFHHYLQHYVSRNRAES